ncbi:PRC-barrel domain-containing protein [Botrimarina sp.]|uniref:PRC-barrel domain-containing protein n=1 Tax=Botrimarina sp. TaxID=2795802 RepID=UPI0032EF3BEB
MKYSTFFGVALALGLTPAALWAQAPGQATPAYEAQKPVAEQNQRDRLSDQRQNQRQYDRSQSDSSNQKLPQGLVRASQMMDKAVYNGQDEQIGSIDDVVLDAQSGEIKYVALSTGGFLGLGDALHAVPFSAFKHQQKDGEQRCILNVSKEQLENAKGFNQDNWPQQADKNWEQQNNRQQYDSQQSSTRQPGQQNAR